MEIDFTFESSVQVIDGRLNTENAEEMFYKFLRHNEKQWLEEAAEEEKSNFIDSLTDAQEAKLKEEHMKQYRGTDDDAPDDYEYWLSELSLEEIKNLV